MSDWRKTLDDLAEAGLLREPITIEGCQGPRVRVGDRQVLCFCSNNYLGLAGHPALAEAAKGAIDEYGTSSGASRLVSGTMRLHRELEELVARFKRTDAAVVFPTGYMANVGTIQALVGRGDTVYCDRLNHASIFDGCRLSGATVRVYPHRDVGALCRLLRRKRRGRTLVVTDTVFSMDGDLAPRPELVEACEQHGARLMIDEAHATGVLGNNGRGAAEHFGVEGQIPVGMGTLSKAIGSLGGYVAGSRDLVGLLVNRARSFIYTTAPPPAVCAATIAGIRMVQQDRERRVALWERVKQLQTGLRKCGYNIGNCETHITPLMIGDSAEAVALSKKLFERDILAPAIRPPTVPEGTARIRLSPIATHTPSDIEALLEALG